ncbi:hypothetical protein [Bacteroides acidifaciens]|nr:hypothetical protein [Bacteroides acidifaciens]
MKIPVPVDTTVAYELVLYPAYNPNDSPPVLSVLFHMVEGMSMIV